MTRHKLAPDFASRRRKLDASRRILIKCPKCKIVDLATKHRKSCRFCGGAVEPLEHQ